METAVPEMKCHSVTFLVHKWFPVVLPHLFKDGVFFVSVILHLSGYLLVYMYQCLKTNRKPKPIRLNKAHRSADFVV